MFRSSELLKMVYVSVMIGLGPDAAAMHVYMSIPTALCSIREQTLNGCEEHDNLGCS